MIPDAPLLEVRGLTVDFTGAEGHTVRALHGIDLAIGPGETFALVGESGSGKSVTSLAIMGLLDRRRSSMAGEVLLRGADGTTRDLLRLGAAEMTAVRGGQVSMVFQEPMTSLNPVRTVGDQIVAPLRLHRRLDRKAARAVMLDSLAEVGIPDPVRRARAYPHELSGGMRQRVLIALALACNSRILIADEPTTALDVTVQAQILDLIKRLQIERGMAVLFITHSLAVVAEIADRVGVMYGGRIVEQASAADLFDHPRHPYTRGLLGSLPGAGGSGTGRRLTAIPGSVVDLRRPPPGCAFEPRCTLAIDRCGAPVPMFAVERLHGSRCVRWAEI